MAKKFVKQLSWGPFPEPHTHPNGGKWPPDGDAQPETPEEQRGIGLSYPEGYDFGPYVEHLGECPRLWYDLGGAIGPGAIFDGPFSTGNVHPHTGLLLFSLAVNARPLTIIETGIFYGYSTWFLAKALDWWGDEGSKVYTLDPDPSKVAKCVREHPRVQIIPKTSHEALPGLVADLGEVDFAFLDSYKRLALMEFDCVQRAMPPGGIVAFHDTQAFNTGRTLWRHLKNREGWDKMLFAGTPSTSNPHRFFGNADDRGLWVLRKQEADPFLGVADHGTHSEALGASLLERTMPPEFVVVGPAATNEFRANEASMSMLPRFCAIVGAPRTGTSLACDLVEACRWSLGPVERSEDPRACRNHLGSLVDAEGVAFVNVSSPQRRHILGFQAACLANGVEAAKIVVDPLGWLPSLKRVARDFRVIVCTRDPREAMRSHIEHALFAAPANYPEWDMVGTTMQAAEAVAQQQEATRRLVSGEGGWHTFVLPFEAVIARDRTVLATLIEFLGIADKMSMFSRFDKIIQPERSRSKNA